MSGQQRGKSVPQYGKSQPGAVGQNMPKALKGERDYDDQGNAAYIPDNYRGRPANAQPFTVPAYVTPNNAKPVSDYVKDNMRARRDYHKGRETDQWGRKYDNSGQHSNRDYWEGNK